MNRARTILADDKGDFYISDGVKIIIAVVLGGAPVSRPDAHLQRYRHPPYHQGNRSIIWLTARLSLEGGDL